MSKTSLKVEGLGKKYAIKSKSKPDSLRELLTTPVFSSKQNQKLQSTDFWAIQDINFELQRGDTLGIIGRNGAGKSTLLKILARVIHPTTGSAMIRGRVASLLEVGTGFHPELTGRENVFFNGALLGMSKSEIAANFKEIVEFSEIDKFLDTPIKRYSSGMRIRLAFSVAVHLDADIMIIDEALSVGDVAFRAKSLEKMKAAAFTGKTVLFVTHAMASAQELCNKGLLLTEGQGQNYDSIEDAINAYMGQTEKPAELTWKAKSSKRPDKRRMVPKSMHLEINGKKLSDKLVSYGESVDAVINVAIKEPSDKMSVGLSLFDENDRRIFRTAHTDNAQGDTIKLKKGKNSFRVTIPTDILKPGTYKLAADFDIENESWVVRPTTTDARVGFSVGQPENIQLWNPKREALIKPILNWSEN